MDDFKGVAIGDLHVAQRRPRDDLQVALDREALRVKAKLGQHAGNGRSGTHPPGLAVDPN